MSKIHYLKCDHCDRQEIDDDSTPNWLIIENRSVNETVCFDICSLECLFGFYESGKMISSMMPVVLRKSFLDNATQDYRKLTDKIVSMEKENDELHKSLEEAKSKNKPSNSSATPETPLDGKKKKRYRHVFSPEEEALIGGTASQEQCVALFYRKWPNSKADKKRLLAKWVRIHEGPKGLTMNEKIEFTSLEVNSEPMNTGRKKHDTEKPEEPKIQEPKGIIKRFMYTASDTQPWLERFMTGNLVKSDSCMDKMKDAWLHEKHTSLSSELSEQHMSQIPDGAFLRYDNYYDLWVNATSVASLKSLVIGNGNIELLMECE